MSSHRARCSPQRRLQSIAILFCLLGLTTATFAAPVSISLVPVGDPGNAPDPTGFNSGSVSYSYNIGKYDVTNEQYAAFLNTVDPTGANTYQLYSSLMATGSQGGISWNGSAYMVKPGLANKPVVYVSWYDAA